MNSSKKNGLTINNQNQRSGGEGDKPNAVSRFEIFANTFEAMFVTSSDMARRRRGCNTSVRAGGTLLEEGVFVRGS